MEGGNPPPRNRPQPLANDPFDEDEIAKRANDEVPRQRTASVGHGFQVQGSVADFDPGTLKTGSVSGNFALPMSWRKLNYSAGELRILCGLTGTALPGRCLAILGSSGAGKTTFLNAICDRLAEDRHLKLSGRRQLGDVEYERHYRKAMGFVAQDDIVSSLSTPYDALWFSLRTRRGTDRAETEARVQEALEVLRLQHCRDTKIGIPGLEAGLSGGERKRCNIGIELIVDPKILLLDEPTSGLDSVTSAKVVHLLRQLSRMGRTIIYTIHQPTAEVLSYFDDLMLMTQGRVAYHGTMAASLGYFESIGFPCPEKYTPTDYFMVMLQDPVTSTILIKRWRKYLKNGPRSPHTAAVRLAKSRSESSAAKFLDAYIKKFGSSPFVQFYELTRRSVIEISRDRLYIFSLASQATFFAVVVGLVFLHVRDNVEGIQDREGMLFMTVMNRAMGSTFIMIDAFERVRAVYTREQQAGAYSPLLYYVGRSLAEFPLQIFFIFVECAILYWMVGLYRKPGEFFYYFGAISMVSQVASGLGFAISSSFPSLLIAAAMAPLILLPLAMAGGLFASTERLRPYWYWLEKPSFMRHGYILVLRNELNNVRNVACNNYNKGDAYCINQARDGKVVLRLLGFDGDPQSTDVWMWVSLAIMFFLCHIISVIALSRAGHAKT
ncbi:putative mitochondrial ATP-binding cassette protein subfamily G, member 2, putative (ABCG2) [Leptomonas pyrrhocoris]|uniref:Putative mitochondrial ATP-binding cassette protein subfamily G, member 2, putative (ABCG2) n=1 Tax=Leptomonas pyrrhocoris TaxID=157538 RepID=A0A0M9G6X6_LEPPY|nr:putative mitochondrial ATP-binding cassette protein subfamily G, member 2, putative (ABCG2) [Leptomonas pyrrhocoris]XP_015662007.1 putative mitochondrial ATP-binding cassette protein subfamily G, member 2, putative (ABCG2) [Leptomonas pyrrhocoris]XP_015662008.1 putative mitochondrial ATP-binding cassette protein subfamily G, member 2, putative (ABCG2) [Leptomonas pyrrhocoris]XP_015662009.1 putative mitochondrial ATP-binding cassette protein subfamily G, member 2, putative (ABCG2) [Leptomonas |eukprot:XP_015662006.1 putative mitochondrial ATP-binding cassette protein subfamily G, member 2, putative (ABCG2) [Leptomonas pyrrhocoris]